jgi:hydroxymethylpyrimidine pyrophosphatase-like HAD family hydrolase
MLVVFDIDGTLANIEHRLDYVRSKPKNWKAFDAGIPNDKVNEPVAEVFFSLRNDGHDIIFASGRNERSRNATIDWLDRKNFWCADSSKLYMRKADDYRSDDIVKQEILDEIIRDYGKKPDMVFDDRPRVVRMWRDNGIFVFNVYQGEDDF